MHYKKYKSIIKEFTNFSSLGLKDLQKIELYFYSNSEQIKNREYEFIS